MSWHLRVLLIAAPIWMVYYVLLRIRKSKMQIDDSVFWLFFSCILLLIGVFPNIAIFFSILLGVQSPANLVFLTIIFLLTIRIFLLDLRISKLNHQLTQTIQSIAINQEKDKNINRT
ncbi:MAG: DUF2304 domain-containing protein [Clostridia bacterium]|nr:DUF2304 domain-containing protein [Clostridia bacterium]